MKVGLPTSCGLRQRATMDCCSKSQPLLSSAQLSS